MDSELQQLRKWLGPDKELQFDPHSGEDPFDYIERLLTWGAPAGASLAGCVIQRPPAADGCQPASVDLAALHAAGCFPHAWGVPLTAADVEAANTRAAAARAADGAGRSPARPPPLPAAAAAAAAAAGSGLKEPAASKASPASRPAGGQQRGKQAQVMLPLVQLNRACPSENLRFLLGSLKHLVPKAG